MGWHVSDRLEQDNDFCNACHLTADRPLHLDIRRDFDGAPPATLAALHGAARVEARSEDPAFRCIDCHGGASFVGRLRVKALAAKDAAVYLTGRFEEPRSMRFPLWDEDCRKCHGSFRAAASDAAGETAGATPFHALAVHNTNLGVGCVECHTVHERGGNREAYFLDAAVVRTQCARCHAELAGE